jgi:hypothetical protein
MNREAVAGGSRGRGRSPAGASLDRLPAGLYVAAHVMFLVVAAGFWWRAGASTPVVTALALYAVSQVGFLSYFAKLITMKLAVLAEQALVLAALLILILAR